MKFETTKFLGTKQIFRFPDHYVAIPVMVSDENVAFNDEGKKIVPMGTIVGGGVLSDPSVKVSDAHYGIVFASAISTVTDVNGKLKFTARKGGTSGNGIKVSIEAGTDNFASVKVDGTDITVTVAVDADSNVVTTANEVIAAILEDSKARRLVDVLPVGDGSAAVKEEEITLADGANSNVGTADGVLVNDVDVTHGPNVGAMCIHGFIDVNKIPVEPTADDIDALPLIKFIY